MDALCEIVEQPKQLKEATIAKVIRTMADITKTPEAARELIKTKKVGRLIDIFERNARMKGVVEPGLAFLTNIAKLKEGKEELQHKGIGMNVISKLIDGPQTKSVMKTAVALIGNIATSEDLNKGLCGCNPGKPVEDDIAVLSNLVLDRDMLRKAVEKVRASLNYLHLSGCNWKSTEYNP